MLNLYVAIKEFFNLCRCIWPSFTYTMYRNGNPASLSDSMSYRFPFYIAILNNGTESKSLKVQPYFFKNDTCRNLTR